MQPQKKKYGLDAGTLGKIVLARCLAQPLNAYERSIMRIEASPSFRSAYWARAALVSGASVDATLAMRQSASPVLGRIVPREDGLAFIYRHEVLAREYHLDEHALSGVVGNGMSALVHRLRLINSRNRLTHALIAALLELQRDFLVTGNPLALVPLPQARMSRHLSERAGLPMAADPGRISRLVRGLAVALPDGRSLALIKLFPSERLLHCHRLDFLVKKEKQLLLAGEIARPWSDAQLVALLEQQHGIRLSRRSIAAIRHQLAVPDCRRRAALADYRAATEGFSALLPLTPSALATHVPPRSGVYEIRAPVGADENRCSTDAVERLPVVYIGSTRDLRKRLSDHLRGNSGNMTLHRHLAEGRAKVRFRIVEEHWRHLERRLYLAYRETFGVPPPCNRMSP